MSKKYYYDIADDFEACPDAWAYLVIGGRGTGKTYSILKYLYENRIKFVFMKRTNRDVQLITSGSGKVGSKLSAYAMDLSPFKSLNRDMGWNVKAFSVAEGLGGFWDCDEDGSAMGEPVGYIVSLNSVQKFKGFDLSDCSYIVFDEFIPMIYEKVNRKEGDQLLDFFKTVERDKIHRGQELKLVCLANSTNASNPTFNILELTDTVVQMDLNDIEYMYDESRYIFLHKLKDSEDFKKKEMQSKIYKSMEGTQWADMSLNNKFAYNDFSNVAKVNLKLYKPVVSVNYKKKQWFVYQRDGYYFMTEKKNDHAEVYDLNRENDQKRFYTEWVFDLRDRCINNNMVFESYTMYDVIMNYKKHFVV